MLIESPGIMVKDWFGLLELYFIVEEWRPCYATWNRWARSSTTRWGVFIVDRAFWEEIGR